MTNESDATVPRTAIYVGDYELVRKLGEGGFGVVWEARHRVKDLPYALKRLHLSAKDAKRFRAEAIYPSRIASQSLHVLGVLDFFHDAASDAFCLITELMPHGDLRAFLDREPKPLPLAQALSLAIGIAKGLTAIHAQGIIHRDLKPANVLMDRKDDRWVPKIADFGLARSTDTVTSGQSASSGYAAPEQLDMMAAQPPGQDSDLFSFGMILYELLTGERAAPPGNLQEYHHWLFAKPSFPAPSAVRPELAAWPALDALVASLLTFDRAQRTTTAPDAVRVLTQVLQQVERGESGTVVGDAEQWRTALLIATAFAATGFAMAFGAVGIDGVPAPFPLSQILTTKELSPLLVVEAVISSTVLPSLFGLALGLAARLDLKRSAVVSLLAGCVYQVVLFDPDSIVSISLGRTLGRGSAVIPGMVGAIAMLAVISPWRRVSSRGFLTIATIGGISGAPLLISMADNERLTFATCFVLWQVAVGLAVVHCTVKRSLVTTSPRLSHSVGTVVTLALALSAAGTWLRSANAAWDSDIWQVNRETVLHRETGLEWAGHDNGTAISWNDAGPYCASLTLGGSSDWRLPSAEELSRLYRAVENRQQVAIRDFVSWHPVPGVRASDRFFWSSTRSINSRISTSDALAVDFSDGDREASFVDGEPYDHRALCVRGATR